MKVRHQPTHFKRFMRRFVHSWWAGVALLVILAVGIAVYQKTAISRHTDIHSTATSSTSARMKMTTSLEYGIALGGTLSSVNATQRAAVLAQIKAAGFSSVRFNLDWVDTESVKGKYNWTGDDSLMQAVKKSGLKSIILVDRAPEWARLTVCRSSPVCSPQNSSDYASFVGAAASRYKSYQISAWEIWNEENSDNFWKPLPNASQYAQLLIAADTAIKKADPATTVLVGGLSGDSVDKLGPSLIDPRTFLTKLYAANVKDYFDGVAYHPYIAGVGLPTKQSDYNGWLKMDNGAGSMRDIMVAQGDGSKSIWITEFGVPTGGKGPVVTDPTNPPVGADHATLAAQNEIAEAVVGDLKQMPWVKEFDWYTYKDGVTANSNSGAAYGVWQSNGKPKPILQTLQDAIQGK